MLLEQIRGHNIFQDLDLEEPLQILKIKSYMVISEIDFMKVIE